MGDVLSNAPLPADLDTDKVAQAVAAAFEPAEGLTAAFVVTHKGRIIGERYGDGITMHTPLESWSMGKSLTATWMGVLIEQGVYDLCSRRRCRSGRPRATRARRSASPTSCTCRADCGFVGSPTPTSTRRSGIRITCMSTPAPSTPSSGPPPGRNNGRRTPSALPQLGPGADQLSHPDWGSRGAATKPVIPAA